jgi:hypothetical protein
MSLEIQRSGKFYLLTQSLTVRHQHTAAGAGGAAPAPPQGQGVVPVPLKLTVELFSDPLSSDGERLAAFVEHQACAAQLCLLPSVLLTLEAAGQRRQDYEAR